MCVRVWWWFRDYIGCFTVGVFGAEEQGRIFMEDHDDYNKILLQVRCFPSHPHTLLGLHLTVCVACVCGSPRRLLIALLKRSRSWCTSASAVTFGATPLTRTLVSRTC